MLWNRAQTCAFLQRNLGETQAWNRAFYFELNFAEETWHMYFGFYMLHFKKENDWGRQKSGKNMFESCGTVDQLLLDVFHT